MGKIARVSGGALACPIGPRPAGRRFGGALAGLAGFRGKRWTIQRG
jgi:hypothetical protein